MRLPKLSSGLAKSRQDKGHLEESGMRDKKKSIGVGQMLESS